MRFKIGLILVLLMACSEGDNFVSPSQGSGGSLTRFAIKESYLYIASGYAIIVYDIRQGNFAKINEVTIGFGLETIQATGEYLYLGARDAMYIYSIADRTKPEFIFLYAHIVACDPVVVQGNRAYVTLRSGILDRCTRGVNVLEIIDISNPKEPVMLNQYPMTSPGGLGIYGNCLFVCEGEAGLKMLSVADDKIKLLNEIKDVNAYDVIVKNGTFTLTGEDGIFQYHYACESATFQLISTIPVQRAEL